MLHVGFNSVINKERIIAMADATTASVPIRRAVTEAADRGQLIDLTRGRKTGAVFFMDNGDIVLAPKTGSTFKEHLIEKEE